MLFSNVLLRKFFCSANFGTVGGCINFVNYHRSTIEERFQVNRRDYLKKTSYFSPREYSDSILPPDFDFSSIYIKDLIVDKAGVVKKEFSEDILTDLDLFSQNGDYRIIVIVIDSFEGIELKDVPEVWNLRLKDILLIITTDDKKVRLGFGSEVPYYYREKLTDVADFYMVPFIQKEFYTRGIITGVEQMFISLQGKKISNNTVDTSKFNDWLVRNKKASRARKKLMSFVFFSYDKTVNIVAIATAIFCVASLWLLKQVYVGQIMGKIRQRRKKKK